MLIILEGPDCAGKTTLARALQRRARVLHVDEPTLHHRGPPTGHPLDEYEVPLFHHDPLRSESAVICDRWHIGELVYPQVLNRPTQYDAAVHRHVELFLRSRGALLVHVGSTDDYLVDCWKRRGDDLVTIEQLLLSARLFADAVATSILPVIDLEDVGDPADLHTIDVILDEAHRHALSTRPISQLRTYVGPPKPDLLLLGDVRHRLAYRSADDPVRRGPAFMPYPGTSGHYLLTHLATVNNIGLANACDVDDPVALITALGGPQVATLGVNSLEALEDVYPAGSAPHPQFVRRFHNRHGAEYGAVVLEALRTGGKLHTWRP